MDYRRVALSACVVSLLLAVGAAWAQEIKRIGPAATQATTRPAGAAVAASAASVIVDPATGNLLSIRLGDKDEMAAPHPAGSEVPFGYLEVVDLRDHRTYNPLTAKSTLSDWKVTGSGDAAAVSFVQQYDGAPFRIVQTLRPTPAGVRWEATVRLLEGQKDNRSVQVNFTLPLPTVWRFWGPVGEDSVETDGVLPLRFVYGHGVSGPMATILPLVGVWGGQAGAAVFSPPDIQKCQIIFDVHTQGLMDAATGVFRHAEDLQTLQVTHQMIGLRPGKDLNLAVCIAGTRPDYRAVYGHYVTAYPELFEPIPETRKYEGMYGITTPAAWQGDDGRRASAPSTRPGSATRRARPFRPARDEAAMIANRVTCLEMHGHFMEYSRYITPEQMANPDMPIVGGENPRGNLTVNINRAVFAEVMKAGIAPFVYFYNVHALPKNFETLFPNDVMVDELGKKEAQWFTECCLVAQPDTAFGKNLLEQLGLLLQAYPDVPGYFVDNYSIEKVDFAHDDGVTMVHNKPAYDLNRNHQVIGTMCLAMLHKAGKVTMVNKLSTIESARGADMVLVEGGDSQHMIMHAMACPTRALFPLGWDDPDKTRLLERHFQTLLLWGGTPDTEMAADAQAMEAYRPLTDAMIGKRWVFDANPLTLPAGYQGQIFRIDPAAAHGGDVVVSLADMKRSWQDEKLTEGTVVTVRLPEAGQYKQATWLGAEKSTEAPQAVEMTTEGEKITLKLPPTGAAGILRLSK